MKRIGLVLLCLAVLCLLAGCDREGTENVNSKTSDVTAAVTIRNGVTEADVWLLPDTAENRSTSLWGTATEAKVKTEESRKAALPEPGDDGRYLLRMIDTDGMYYSADGLTLANGWQIEIREVDIMRVTATVTDENGAVQSVYDVFSAHL